jgi:sensor histidine kinase YesM
MNQMHDMENRNHQYQDEISSLEMQLKTAQAVSNARITELEGQLTPSFLFYTSHSLPSLIILLFFLNNC